MVGSLDRRRRSPRSASIGPLTDAPKDRHRGGAVGTALMSHGLLKGAGVSDDAGQLSAITRCGGSMRLIHKLVGFNEKRRAIDRTRARVWRFYAALNAATPIAIGGAGERFERSTATGFATLDRLLARLHACKDALLVALESRHPAPHQSLGERHPVPGEWAQNLRRHAQRRRRDARDAFLGGPNGVMGLQSPHGRRRPDHSGVEVIRQRASPA